jgi:hypothetical protein
MPTASLRRTRGALLRLVYSRPVAATVGGMLTVGFVTLRIAEFGWESRLSDGLGLVLGATGVAMLLAAIGGRRPDWVDPADGGPGPEQQRTSDGEGD